MDTSGCASLRSSHLLVTSPCAIKTWELLSLHIKNASSQVDGFTRNVCLKAPSEWEPLCSNRVWNLEAAAYNINDAPAAFRCSLERHQLDSDASLKRAGPRRQLSTVGPCLFFIFRNTGSAACAFTTRIDDILGCGEPDVLPKIRDFPERRFGGLKLQESSFAHVSMELVQAADFPVTLTQGEIAQSLKPFPTSPQFWSARQTMSSLEDMKLRQCKLGELHWLATVSRPDICTRSTHIASEVTSSQGSDVYRINDLVETVEVWQQDAILMYFASPQMSKGAIGGEDGQMRQRGDKIHEGTMTLVGWPDTAYGDPSTMGKWRLG